jgi:ABC-type nitrate/sulfonate/bicarbonate transport system substrate-binding protein
MRELVFRGGLDPDADVSIVALGQRYPQILTLLARRDLDAAIISEPHVSMGEEAGYFNVWLGVNRCDFAPRMQWTIVVANVEALMREPDLVRGVLRGCRRSYHYAADHRDEWADFGGRYFHIPRETMLRSIERELPDLHFDCEIDMEGLAAAIALQRRLGSVPASLALSDILDSRFSQAACPAVAG